MIQKLVEEIKLIIDNIYKSTYESYKDNLEEEGLKDFISSLKYYELLIEEINFKYKSNKLNNLDNVINTLNQIKKDLKAISSTII